MWSAAASINKADLLGASALLLRFNEWVKLPLDNSNSILHHYSQALYENQGGSASNLLTQGACDQLLTADYVAYTAAQRSHRVRLIQHDYTKPT